MAAASLTFASHHVISPLVKVKLPAISCQAAGVGKRRNVNFYRVLELESEKVSALEIKRAYRSLARRFHPDVCPPERREECAQVLVEVNRAYEVLSDPIMRRNHDVELGVEMQGGVGREWGRGVRKLEFPRETWERQLAELGRRSALRRQQRRGQVVVVVQ